MGKRGKIEISDEERERRSRQMKGHNRELLIVDEVTNIDDKALEAIDKLWKESKAVDINIVDAVNDNFWDLI